MKPKQPKPDEVIRTADSNQSVSDERMELKYEKYEVFYHNKVLEYVKKARDDREMNREEFDGMRYSEKIKKNRQIGMGYTPPAKNRYDVRLNPQITNGKIISAISLAVSYNFNVEVLPFDDGDDYLPNLGKACSDLIYKSDKMEEWDSNRELTYLGMTTYGTYYTLESQEFPISHNKTFVPLKEFGSLKADWKDTARKKKVEFKTINLDPRSVLLGNINETDLKEQPYIVFTKTLSYAKALETFGTFDRFKYVSAGNNQVGLGDIDDLFQHYKSNYAVNTNLKDGDVEVLYFMRSLAMGNELQIYCNGIAMLPVKMIKEGENQTYTVSGFPLTSWSRSGEYPITAWHFERIPNFFYSKGFPDKTGFDEAVVQFFFTHIVKKAMRSIAPTLVNNTGTNITEEMLQPGSMLTDIQPDRLKSLLPTELIEGISNGDVSMLNMVRDTIDGKTMTKEFQGQSNAQYQTAIQFSEQQKAQLQKLGSFIDGIIAGEKRRADLRLRNSVIPYWLSRETYDGKTKQAKSEQIRSSIVEIYDVYNVERETDKGTSTSAIAVTGDTSQVSPFDLLSKEEEIKEKTGKETRYTFIDPDKLDFFRTLFFYKVVQSKRENDALEKAETDRDIITAMNLFPENIDREKMMIKYAKARGENFDDYFQNSNISADMLGMGGDLAGDSTLQSLAQPQQSDGQIRQGGGFNPSNVVPPSSLGLQ